jgi:hypothetical protein
MARFQAQTNAVLDQELESLRSRLGLASSQKADLLREVAELASWVVRQAEEGRVIEARRGKTAEILAHPAIERLRSKSEGVALPRLALTGPEAKRLRRVLDRPFVPKPALRRALRNLASPKRRAPTLRWRKTV